MDFNWAIKKLKEGKKVRRKHWFNDRFICFNDVGDTIDGPECRHYFTKQSLEATDWEIFDDSEKNTLDNLNKLKFTETVNIFGKDFEVYTSPDFWLILSNIELFGKKAYDIYKKNKITFQEDIQEHLDNIFNSKNESKEETLSDKIIKQEYTDYDNGETITVEDVKEAVSKLKDIWMLDYYKESCFQRGKYIAKLKEIFGDKLI